MTRLQQEFGAEVLLLSCHVDYWDSLGWTDTFTSGACTERQKRYGDVFQQDSIYTPEMVMDGEVGFVGSDGGRARDEIRARLARRRPAASLTLQASGASSATLAIHLPPDLLRQARKVSVFVVEDAAPVHVLKGENAGATLGGENAVRGVADYSVKEVMGTALRLSLPAGANASHTRVAVLIQGAGTTLLAAVSSPWPR